MKKIYSTKLSVFTSSFVLVALLAFVISVNPQFSLANEKVNICHQGKVLSVNSNGLNGHEGHPTDFIVDDTDQSTTNDTATCLAMKPFTLTVNKQFVGTTTVSASGFSFAVNNGAPVAFEGDASNNVAVSSGTYSVTETQTANYTTSYSSNLAGHANDCTNLPVAVTDETESTSVVCTVTNTYSAPETPKTCVFGSDATTLVGTAAAVPSFVHPNWTSSLVSASPITQWIWNAFHATPSNTTDEIVTFTKTFNVVGTPTAVKLDLAADNYYSVSVNGTPSCADQTNLDNFSTVEPTCNITSLVHTGVNTLTFVVNNKSGFGTDPEQNPGGLIYKVTIDGATCSAVPTEPTFAKVHLYKYLASGNTETQVPDSFTGPQFPMTATWSATNIGAGSGAYVLGNQHGGAAFKWAADTSAMQEPVVHYTSSEVTGGDSPVVASSEQCAPGKYFLKGYRSGTSLVGAQTAPLSATAPDYTNFTGDRYVLVVNQACATAPTTFKVHVFKFLDNNDSGSNQIPNSATTTTPVFPMIATYSIAGIGSNLNPGDGYDLGNGGGVGGSDDGLLYAANTIPLSAGDIYGTHEVVGGNSPVVASSGQCAPGKYTLVGYKVGDTKSAAMAAVPSTTAPTFSISKDEYVIVVNKACPSVIETTTSSTIVVRATDLDSTSSNPFVVLADGLNKWFFYNDTTDVVDNSIGSFVTGPATAPLGTGSAEMNDPAANSRPDIATFQFQGTKLADIKTLAFSSYSNPGLSGAGPTESPYLVFNVDFTGVSGAFQGRLVYVPGNNGAVAQNTWNTNDTINGGAGNWVYSGATWPAPIGGSGTVSKTWAQILAAYPSARLLPAGGFMGVRVGEPGPAGYTGNVDKFVIGIKTGTNTDTKTYDFEPTAAPVVPACSDVPDTVGLTTFDSFNLGNVNGQQSWTSTGAYDQAVVPNTYGYATFGCKSLRLSNAVTSGGFGDQTFAAPVVPAAGETVVNKHYEAQFDIASTLLAQQPGLSVSVSPDDGNGSRMSYLRFEDQADGIHVFFYDVQGLVGGTGNFVQTALPTITRTPHTIKFSIDFVNGAGNDVVKIYIDGVLVHTGTSWEDYYRFDPEQAGNGNQLFPIDTLIFRAGGTAVTANNGKGFLFDNLSLTTTAPTIAPVTPTVTTPTTTGGGRSGGRSSGGGGGGRVLGASTTGQVLGESCGVYLDRHLRLGSKKNDKEQASKMQTFLNKWMGSNLPVTGFYGPLTTAAVKSFQAKYGDDILTPWGIKAPTGIVYYTTLHKVNELECPEAAGEKPTNLVDWSKNPSAQ